MIAQTLLVLKLTDNGLAIGLLAACQFGPVLVIGAWAGLVADRSDKRRLLIIVQTLAMAAVLRAGRPRLQRRPAAAGHLRRSPSPAASPSRSTTRPGGPSSSRWCRTTVQNAVSLNSALMTSARIVGPALAGLLVHTVGYGWCFLLDGLSYIAVIVGLWLMRTPSCGPRRCTPRAKGQVRAGLRYVRSGPGPLDPAA